MGSPLGPVLANIFMVELENQLIPKTGDKVLLWERYVDDTFTFIKKIEIESVKELLNSFHPDIQFTHEIEADSKISFLDVSVERNLDGTFHTSVYRKKSDTNLYINWEAFAPKAWKIGTLKGLIRRAFVVSSDENRMNNEICYLKHVFRKINGYPSKVIFNSISSVKKVLKEKNNQK